MNKTCDVLFCRCSPHRSPRQAIHKCVFTNRNGVQFQMVKSLIRKKFLYFSKSLIFNKHIQLKNEDHSEGWDWVFHLFPCIIFQYIYLYIYSNIYVHYRTVLRDNHVLNVRINSVKDLTNGMEVINLMEFILRSFFYWLMDLLDCTNFRAQHDKIGTNETITRTFIWEQIKNQIKKKASKKSSVILLKEKEDKRKERAKR